MVGVGAFLRMGEGSCGELFCVPFLDVTGLAPPWWWGWRLAGVCWWCRGGASGVAGARRSGYCLGHVRAVGTMLS